MHAWQLTELGGPEQLRWVELPDRQPGPGEVRVRIVAAALNFLDTLMLGGRYQYKPALPFIPGVEFSGVVEAVGEGVRVRPGTAVAGVTATGAFATHVVVAESACMQLPAALDLVAASSLPIVYPTAWLALYELAQLKAGDRVLVSAAAGGVGLAALELARLRGAIAVGLASASKHPQCLEHGATAVFDYGPDGGAAALKQWLAGESAEGFDVVLDMVGGAVGLNGLKRLAWGGRYLTVGYAGGEIPAIPANLLLLKQARAIGVWWGEYVKREPAGAKRVLAGLFEQLLQGTLKPVISQRFPMSQLQQALTDLAARRSSGKLVAVND